MNPSGLDVSYAVNAYWAVDEASLPLVNKKRADFLFWKICSTAFLSKGMTAELTYKAKIKEMRRILDMISDEFKFYKYFSNC